MNKKHMHEFQWGILNAGKSNSAKIQRCVICKMDLSAFLEQQYNEIDELKKKVKELSKRK